MELWYNPEDEDHRNWLENFGKKKSDNVNDNRADDFNILRAVPSGYIYFIDIPIIKISSSMIRECYKINKPTNNYLASDIIDYIKINNLYK